MDCDEVTLRLWEYLDQELDPEDGVEVKAHLDRCPHCYPAYQCDRAFLNLLARLRSSCLAPATLVQWARHLT
jgi:mycothiol system anti-sigma-R factor